jgi:hypothetical protein
VKCLSFENAITRNTLHYATVRDVIYEVFQNNVVQKDTRIYGASEVFTDSKGLGVKMLKKMELIIRAGYACLNYTSNLGMCVHKKSWNSLNVRDPNSTHCY